MFLLFRQYLHAEHEVHAFLTRSFPNKLLGYLQVFQDFSYDSPVGFVDGCHVY